MSKQLAFVHRDYCGVNSGLTEEKLRHALEILNLHSGINTILLSMTYLYLPKGTFTDMSLHIYSQLNIKYFDSDEESIVRREDGSADRICRLLEPNSGNYVDIAVYDSTISQDIQHEKSRTVNFICLRSLSFLSNVLNVIGAIYLAKLLGVL